MLVFILTLLLSEGQAVMLGSSQTKHRSFRDWEKANRNKFPLCSHFSDLSDAISVCFCIKNHYKNLIN